METPLWILAISQLVLDVVIVVLLIALIIGVVSLVCIVKKLGSKGEQLLDTANDAVEYVKESKLSYLFKMVFSPHHGFKYFRKHKNDDKN